MLEGKNVLITGAGSGIGRALAIEASRLGLTVAICGRRAQALIETRAMLHNHSGNHLTLPGDITSRIDRETIVQTISHNWGKLDFLINNAGVIDIGALENLSDDSIEHTFKTNVLAPILLTKAFLPLLSAARPSRIVNIGSVFGEIPFPIFSSYSASKAALRAFSISLRRELKDKGIFVTYAALRATETEATQTHDKIIRATQPKLDSPSDVAARIWKALERGDDTIYPPGPERFFVILQTFLPGAVDQSVIKQMAEIISASASPKS